MILSAVFWHHSPLARLATAPRNRRDFCYKFDKFENICLDGDHASSDVKSQDKSTPDRSDDPPKNDNNSSNDNNNNNNSGNNNNGNQNDSKKDAEKDCNCNYGGSYDQ